MRHAFPYGEADMMRSRYFGAALLLAFAACNWGTRPENLANAMGPEGARVALRVSGESADRVGELVAADTSGMTLRTSRLVHIRWSRVEALDVLRMGSDYDVHFGEALSAEKRARLSLVSRFPQGLSGELLRAVLAALSQSELEEVR